MHVIRNSIQMCTALVHNRGTGIQCLCKKDAVNSTSGKEQLMQKYIKWTHLCTCKEYTFVNINLPFKQKLHKHGKSLFNISADFSQGDQY